MEQAIKSIEIIGINNKPLYPEKRKDAFYWDMQPYFKLAKEYRLWLVSTTQHKGSAVSFREYAQRQFKPETPELADAQQRLTAALEEAALTAEVLGNELRRYNNRMRANKWHGRSWGRKEW